MPRRYTRPKTVTHPSTTRAQRRVTSFMRRTKPPLRQTAASRHRVRAIRSNNDDDDEVGLTVVVEGGAEAGSERDMAVTWRTSLAIIRNFSKFTRPSTRESLPKWMNVRSFFTRGKNGICTLKRILLSLLLLLLLLLLLKYQTGNAGT